MGMNNVEAEHYVVLEHQANYAHILSLRRVADTLNDQITSNLTLLAETRKEILATPATTFAEDQRDIPYGELLTFARNISKYTVPPTSLFRVPPAVKTEAEEQSTTVTNGANNETQAERSPAGLHQSPMKAEPDPEFAVTTLNELEKQWLDPLTQIPFIPWPSEEVIRRGALSQMQGMLEQGIDPATSNGIPILGEDTEVDSKPGMESSTKPDDVKMEDTRQPSAPTRFKEEKPKVFAGLDLYDPDEE